MAHASSRALRRERPLWSARRPLESNVPCSNFEELVPPDENLEVLDAEPMHSGLGWSTPFARISEVEPFGDSATPSPTLANLGVDSDFVDDRRLFVTQFRLQPTGVIPHSV